MLAFTSHALAAPLSITMRGSLQLPATSSDQHGQSFAVTGMSGVVYVGQSPVPSIAHRFAAAMDNSNRVVFIDVVFNPTGSMIAASLSGGLTLSESHDHEGIALGPACSNTFILSDETAGSPASPMLREFDRISGTFIRAWTPPTVFTNARANFGLESLTRSPMGDVLWSANEEALTVDGPVSTQSNGTVVRITRWRISGDAITPTAQYAYETQPIHGGAIAGSRSGLVDLAALPDGRLIALERSFALAGMLFQSRVYELDFAGASDVSAMTGGLIGQTYTRVSKRLLWSGSAANLEGLCLGPPLGESEEGRYVLLGVVDDADPLSQNTIVAFELGGVEPTPHDVDSDGAINTEDEYRWHIAPVDINRDGVSTTDDRVQLTDSLRMHESCDVDSQ